MKICVACIAKISAKGVQLQIRDIITSKSVSFNRENIYRFATLSDI